jgi:hypothetical protein
MDEQRHYDIVAEELRHRFLKPELWTRAMAEVGGENDTSRSLYVRLRMAELAQLERWKPNRRVGLVIPGVILGLWFIWWLPSLRTALMCALGVWAFIASVFLGAIVPVASCRALVQVLRASRMKWRHMNPRIQSRLVK